MRNRQLSEANRKGRLINVAGEACALTGQKRWNAIKRIRTSNDWLRATRVTRGIVGELILRWMEGESIGSNARTGDSGAGNSAGSG